jgi:hypothetical protein
MSEDENISWVSPTPRSRACFLDALGIKTQVALTLLYDRDALALR